VIDIGVLDVITHRRFWIFT